MTDMMKKPKALLFDLDGTLLDSAPDLAAAVNRVKADCGLEPTPYEALRKVASMGSPGLLRVAFGIETTHPDYPKLAKDFIDYYSQAMSVKSVLFDGITELLNLLKEMRISWGIVTNKREHLTFPLVQQIGLSHAHCIIAGDTLAVHKPNPEPVLEAAKRIHVAPEDCWFIGDDPRDILAGNKANTQTIAAKWGYGSDIHTWNADFIAESPFTLIEWLKK